MLLNQTKKRNPKLIETAFSFHQQGLIRPDSYLIDVDQFLENAKKMLEVGKENQVELYFMLKQVGRNPYLAKKLVEMGYPGAVVVDYKEAKVMMEHDIPIGNIGHLVQVPDAFLEEVILYRPEVITVYSLDKVEKIHRICQKHQLKQAILIRVYDTDDLIYSGQTAGIHLNELDAVVERIKQLDTICIDGVTSFPAMLYNEEDNSIEATQNLTTILKAKELLEKHGIEVKQVNIPSATCCRTIPKIASFGGTHGEPGHGLSGSTPAHAKFELEEVPSVIYVSEISHNFEGTSYCYGGGHYRRSHVQNALVGKDFYTSMNTEVIVPELSSIDYHFGLNGIQEIGDTVVMAFRFQLFVTRSDVVLVEGIQSGKPHIIAIYDSLGRVL